MAHNKGAAFKQRLAKAAAHKTAPRWADIKKYGLKRARSRRIPANRRNWRRSRLKV